jgi:S-formylglutathione hydrolase FrmB
VSGDGHRAFRLPGPTTIWHDRVRPVRTRRSSRLIAPALLAVAVIVLYTSAAAPALKTLGATIETFTIKSRLTHQTLPVAAVIPSDATGRKRPLLVFLHGKGENQRSNLNDPMFAALAQLGAGAPDIVFPYGGPDSYWHDRASGDWGSYVVDEVIPQALRKLGADPARVAIGGISMGGFGALDIARRHPGRFCAVGGHSAALWAQGGDSAPGAFDDATDFAAHDVIGAARRGDPYPHAAVWIDDGTLDPFRSADTLLASELRADGHAVHFHIWPGAHDQTYWQSHWAQYLRFYADALRDCRVVRGGSR